MATAGAPVNYRLNIIHLGRFILPLGADGADAEGPDGKDDFPPLLTYSWSKLGGPGGPVLAPEL